MRVGDVADVDVADVVDVEVVEVIDIVVPPLLFSRCVAVANAAEQHLNQEQQPPPEIPHL